MEQRDQVYAQLQTQLQAYGVCKSPRPARREGQGLSRPTSGTQLLPSSPLRSWTSTTPSLTSRTRASMWWPASMGRTAVSSASSLCLPSAPRRGLSPRGGLRYVRTEQLLLDNLKRVFDPLRRGGEKLCLRHPQRRISPPRTRALMWTMTSAAKCEAASKAQTDGRGPAGVRRPPAGPVRLSLQALHIAPCPDLSLRAPMRMGFVHPMLKKLPGTLHSALSTRPSPPRRPPSPSRETYLHLVSAGTCFSATLFTLWTPFSSSSGGGLRPVSLSPSDHHLPPGPEGPARGLCVRQRKTLRRSLPSLNCRPALIKQNNIDWSERLEDGLPGDLGSATVRSTLKCLITETLSK